MREQKLGAGQSIIGFESIEEMQDYLAQQEEIAIAGTLAEQWAITWGDYVIRFVDNLVIWGNLETQEELIESEKFSDAEDEEEARYELEQAMDSHGRGYRFGKWFSTVEPDGEYGSAHVVTLWKITKEDFETAADNDWHIWQELAERLTTEMKSATTGSEYE